MTRRLSCACPACATLFPAGTETKYRRVTPRARRLSGIALGEATWAALGIPVGLSFVTPSRVHDAVVAVHPSRAGTTETRVPGNTWEAFVREHAELAGVEPDVEGVLLSAIGSASCASILSVDLFHRFVGGLRAKGRWSDGAILAALAEVEVLGA